MAEYKITIDDIFKREGKVSERDVLITGNELGMESSDMKKLLKEGGFALSNGHYKGITVDRVKVDKLAYDDSDAEDEEDGIETVARSELDIERTLRMKSDQAAHAYLRQNKKLKEELISKSTENGMNESKMKDFFDRIQSEFDKHTKAKDKLQGEALSLVTEKYNRLKGENLIIKKNLKATKSKTSKEVLKGLRDLKRSFATVAADVELIKAATVDDADSSSDDSE